MLYVNDWVCKLILDYPSMLKDANSTRRETYLNNIGSFRQLDMNHKTCKESPSQQTAGNLPNEVRCMRASASEVSLLEHPQLSLAASSGNILRLVKVMRSMSEVIEVKQVNVKLKPSAPGE